MFVHISVHHPVAGKEAALIDSMHRYGEALKGVPGLISVHALQDEAQNVIMGMAVWESQDAMMASIHLAREAVANDPFDEWEAEAVTGFRLTEV
ncbi:MAG: antibiotic biosynthesis monooxygenase [Chloroflexota bacterium]